METFIRETLREIGYSLENNEFHNGQNRILTGSFESQSSAQSAFMDSKAHLSLATIRNRVNELLSRESSKLIVLTPEGGVFPVSPNGEIIIGETLFGLKDFLTKRLDSAHWFRSIRLETVSSLEEPDRELVDLVLGFTKDANLLTGKSGNISFALPSGKILVTPRGVDKFGIQISDFVQSSVSAEDSIIHYEGDKKPSIDTGVQSMIYTYSQEVQSIIHSHNPWVLGVNETAFPYPCGVREEAEEITKTGVLDDAGESPFLFVNLIHHGVVLFIRNKEEIIELQNQWNEVVTDFYLHMREVDRHIPLGKNTFPILSPEGIVGYVLEHEDGSISPRIHPKHQGNGLGKQLFDAIKKSGKIIKTIHECDVLSVYRKHGFVPVKQDIQTGEIWLQYLKMDVSKESFKGDWRSPIDFRLVLTNDSESFRDMPEGTTGIPVFPHPGSFGAVRKHNIHPGIDLYCREGTEVRAVEDGEVVAVIPFTGPRIGLNWWLDTDAVLVEGKTGVVIYGEMNPTVRLGQKVQAGDTLGSVARVLRNDKGRPTSMLHLELHTHGTRKWYEGIKEEGVLESLRDPTPYLLKIADETGGS